MSLARRPPIRLGGGRDMGRAFVSAIAAFTFAPGSPIHAQQTASIPDRPSCESCSIGIERIALLGDANSDIPFNVPVAAAVDGRGQIYLTMRSSLAEIHIFSKEGQFQTSLGRIGDGPGEYRVIEHVFVRGDSLFVVDPRLLRLTVLDEHHGLVSTTRIPTRPNRATLAHDGGLVINGVWPTTGTPTPPVHRIEPSGEITVSYGDPVSRRLGDPLSATRLITEDIRDSTIWVAHRDRYRLEQFSLDGRLLRVFVRSAPWFEQYQPSADPPKTAVTDISLDSAGHLWVLITALEPDWRRALAVARENQDAPGVNNRVWDSIVEVIDPRSGVLLARTRLDQHMQRFAASLVLFSYDQTDDGVPQISVWRLALRSE